MLFKISVALLIFCLENPSVDEWSVKISYYYFISISFSLYVCSYFFYVFGFSYIVFVIKSCLTPVTPWSVACQALLSAGFPGQEYLSGLPFDECSILSLYWSFYYYIMSLFWGFPDGSDSKDSACNEGPGFDPWVGKTPWNRPWQPTLIWRIQGQPGRLQSMGSQHAVHN